LLIFVFSVQWQCGFREGYSTIDNAYVQYSIINKYLSMKGNSIYVAFTDFQNAFDSVDRCILYEVLHKNFLMVTLKKLISQYTDQSMVVLENIKVVRLYLNVQLVYGNAVALVQFCLCCLLITYIPCCVTDIVEAYTCFLVLLKFSS